jgi:hypothetical protein
MSCAKKQLLINCLPLFDDIKHTIKEFCFYDAILRERKYKNNKEKRLETTKKWKEANDQSIECDCGCIYKRYSQSIHLKSKKHQKYLNTE